MCMTSSTTAALQNQVRIRIFLVMLLGVFIGLLRPYASDSVQNATSITELSYLIYVLILVASLLPFRASWVVSLVAAMAVTGLGGSSVILGTVSTVRCVSAMHAGCIQNVPGSAATLFFGLLVVLLDAYQCWTIYLILRYPSFVSSGLRRIRVLFAWALPFGWLVSGILFYNSSWSPLFSAHLIGDPTIIVLSVTDETSLIWVVLVALGLLDVFAFLSFDVSVLESGGSLLTTSLFAQIGFTLGSMAMLIFGKEPKNMVSENVEKVGVEEVLSPEKWVASESQLRQRQKNIPNKKIAHKSLNGKIAF